jgi:hypothetical protein
VIDGDVLIAALDRRREQRNSGRLQVQLDGGPGDWDRFMAGIGFIYEMDTLIRYVRLLQHCAAKEDAL